MICCWAARHASQQTFKKFASAMLDLLKQPALRAFPAHLVHPVHSHARIRIHCALAMLLEQPLLLDRIRLQVRFNVHGVGSSLCRWYRVVPLVDPAGSGAVTSACQPPHEEHCQTRLISQRGPLVLKNSIRSGNVLSDGNHATGQMAGHSLNVPLSSVAILTQHSSSTHSQQHLHPRPCFRHGQSDY